MSVRSIFVQGCCCDSEDSARATGLFLWKRSIEALQYSASIKHFLEKSAR